MTHNLTIIALVIFCFNLVIYLTFFYGIDLFPDKIVIPLTLVSSIVGVLFSWKGKSGVLRIIGIIANTYPF